MPKRGNPFGDASPLQYKSHIGLKEVAESNSHGNMAAEVYSKTLNLLFLGSCQKNVTHKSDSELEDMPDEKAMNGDCSQQTLDAMAGYSIKKTFKMNGAVSDILRTSSTKDKHKQLTLDSLGNVSCVTAVLEGVEENSCRICRRFAKRSCSYCEKPVCGICLQLCSKCFKKNCHFCCITNYDFSEEQLLCLQCVSSPS